MHTFAQRLILWQKQHGRHDLPWQRTRDPYRIWLSEIMLQQTQVSTVIPYYQRFLTRFPAVSDLANAMQSEVLELWAGLGYYARGRNLHRAAQRIMREHGGVFADDPISLSELPGIGRSTAAAIAVFAFGRRAAILDGNVKRVLCRHAGIDGFPGKPTVERKLWRLAESLLPENDIEAYTQGLMDLGTSVCLRRRPHCATCPLHEDCKAFSDGSQETLPTPKARAPLPERAATFVLLTDGHSVLLERRPPAGIWGGLLVPPEGDPETVLARLGIECKRSHALPDFKHQFTHFRLNIRPMLCQLNEAPRTINDPVWCWQSLDTLESAALPAPMRQILAQLSRAMLDPGSGATYPG